MPNTIDDIIAELQTIIADSIKNKDRAGYFAALYLLVTQSVKQGIADGQFQNGPRMERLDVTFASRYLDAYNAWKNNQPLTGSWETAFENTRKSSVLVLQQLLLGMNAHINLDLGIATAQVMQGQQFEDIRTDFVAINNVISALTNEVLRDLSRVSPLLSLLGLHAANANSPLIQFSIGMARDGAWVFGQELSQKTGGDYTAFVRDRDTTITQLGKAIVTSRGLLKFTIWVIHLFEWKNPARITEVIRDYKKADIKKADLMKYV